MSKLNETSITICEALENIENNKYIMPAFQRQFVWSMEQIEKLWDSILLHYPIATFLFWHVDGKNVSWDSSFSNFMHEMTFNSRKESESVNYDLVEIDTNITDTAILDGQQRLSSLYLSLLGEAHIRPKHGRKKTGDRLLTRLLIELNVNKADTDEEYNAKRYDIKFHTGKSSPTHFDIKDILKDKFRNDSTRESAIEEAIVNVPPDSKDYARNILQTLHNKIFIEKLVRYTEILDMGQDDALEMFVRFNSGGKALKKNEITMSILEAYWPGSKNEFGKLLTGTYNGFGTDFIIRTALMLYGDVIKSNISRKIADELRTHWDEFRRTLANLERVLKELKIDITRFQNSWNVLLPVIYYIYYNPDYKNNVGAIRAYLLRAIVFTYFQSGTTSKLHRMKSEMNDYGQEITFEMLDNMTELRITDAKIEDILDSEKGSRVASEVLYYLSLDWTDMTFRYEQDHLHAESRFSSSRPPSVTPENWSAWRKNRNRLSNLHLLEGRSNGSKNDISLIDYHADMNAEQRARFYETAMIPTEVSLDIGKFDEFYAARKMVLAKKIRALLS